MSWGAETVVLVEIDQPFCTRTWGDAFLSPTGQCNAQFSSTVTRKCYQSRATCPVPAVYNPGTLTLRFARAQEGLLQYAPLLPSILSIDTAPGAINLGGMERNRSALGEREVVTIVLTDHKHSDLRVDPYRLQRISGAASGVSPAETFNPYERGTFWGKWLARNPYHANYVLRVYEGNLGDAVEDMRVRTYIIDRIDGPTDGQVKIVAKDLFSKIERQKAVAPVASRGELDADIAASGVASFLLSPNGIGDIGYPTGTFRVAIGDEVIRVTRSGGSETLTVVVRGDLDTVAEAHDEEDLVQLVLVYESVRAHNIVFDLLCNYTALGNDGSPTESPHINKAAWDTAAATLTGLYTARIATPTPVQDLIGELAEQAGFSIWPDPGTGMIEFKALRAGASNATVTDAGYIVDGSLKFNRRIDQRASQVWVYYGQKSPVEELDERRNYRSRLVTPDLDAEDETQYGTPAIKEIFSRWIPQFGRGLAENTSERLLAMFRDPPIEAEFTVHASRAEEFGLAEYVALETADVQDDTGATDTVQHAVIEVERGENELNVRTQSVTFLDPAVDDGERVIYIENDSYNLNLRTIHDTVFDAPVGGSPTLRVRFVIEPAIYVGSTSTSSPAMQTGTWPAGVQVTLENYGTIFGKGGAGGRGGNATGNSSPSAENGQPGEAGGTALQVDSALILINNGNIWGGTGGSGGGGGASFFNADAGGVSAASAGGGAGAGRGFDGNSGGAAGICLAGLSQSNGSAGGASSRDAGGSAGSGGAAITIGASTADGGNGGTGVSTPGAAGNPGNAGSATGDGDLQAGSGGSAGAAGYAITGNSLVTHGSPTGSILGQIAA